MFEVRRTRRRKDTGWLSDGLLRKRIRRGVFRVLVSDDDDDDDDG